MANHADSPKPFGGNFSEWFHLLTGHEAPHSWQARLVTETECRSRVIRIPTGLGKTEGILTAWSYHRLAQGNAAWPRRLVWCLPMRTLVEQTQEVAERLITRLPEAFPEADRPTVHLLMGGEDPGQWFLYPERPMILIGTQDMLLSRALNRGYAAGRARWPMEFGLLGHDALWVMDEVQLMDVGLATSAQLQAFRDNDQEKQLKPVRTWWMSATLQTDWLESVDTRDCHPTWVKNPCFVEPAERSAGIWDVPKSLTIENIPLDKTKVFAQRVLDEHILQENGEWGRITLAICNTVHSACALFDAVQDLVRKQKLDVELELVHSRFRPAEREAWRDRFLIRSKCAPGTNRLIVSTQVVEAGVDISAGCLFTELSPWPSLVQRFGRCARYGGAGRAFVIDREWSEKNVAPYNLAELAAAREALERLTDVGVKSLEEFEESLLSEVRASLYPFSPAHLLVRQEFDDLFDTTPDLSGADLDIGRFIRADSERDLQIFWLPLEKVATPNPELRPHRRELCSVPFLKARDWLCGSETKTNRKPNLRAGLRAFVWDYIDGAWVRANRAALLPGRIVAIAASCGGYRTDRGFDPESKDEVQPIPNPTATEDHRSERSDDQQASEALSDAGWKTIAVHSREVATEVERIARSLALPEMIVGLLREAARWHDWGKAHPAFQGSIRAADRPNRQDLAKAPKAAWSKTYRYQFTDNSEARPGFRHELASMLGIFRLLEQFHPAHPGLLGPWNDLLGQLDSQQRAASLDGASNEVGLGNGCEWLKNCSAEEFDLLLYLVASHHGKVRVALHATPKDQDYRLRLDDPCGLPIQGIREGDRLPSVMLEPGGQSLPEVELSLEPANLGLSTRTGASWRERCLGLQDRHGPLALAFLEAVLRAADIRASRLTTTDPTLMEARQ